MSHPQRYQRPPKQLPWRHPWQHRVTAAAAGALGGLVVIALAWDDSNLGTPERRWTLPAIVVVGTVVALALQPLARLLPRPGSVPLAHVPVLAGMYACVPETDQIRALAGVTGVFVLLEVVTRARLSWWWHAGLAALVLWAGVYGATARQSALIGGLFAWWPFVLPVAVALVIPRTRRLHEFHPWVVMGIGSLAAVAVARTGGLEPTGSPAARAVAVAAPASAATALAVSGVWLLVSRRAARRAGRHR